MSCDRSQKGTRPLRQHSGRRSSGPTTSGTFPHGPLELVEFKLDVPPPREGQVWRTTLVKRLRSSTDTRFVSVSAPTGYGKTSALSQWAAADDRPFAWLSIDPCDNDPAILLTYLAESLDRLSPLAPAVFRALTSIDGSPWTSAVPRLATAISSMPDPFVLVLDDAQDLEHRPCVDVLMAIARHVPAGSQLVVSGRRDSSLPLAALRARGELLELGVPELALTDGEARELLAQAGVELSEDEAAELNQRAEGWAGGLYLAALALQTAPAHVTVSTFSGSDRFVLDYVRSEHLSRLEQDELEFLTCSAVLDRMCGPLCDALLDRSDSATLLEKVERENLFLVPLDHTRHWYRFHHLFRELLRADLERLPPEVVAGLHRRASEWCAQNGEPEAAVAHARAAGDVDDVAALVATYALPFYRSGRAGTVEDWLGPFDDSELLERFPAVATVGTFLHALRGRPSTAERWAAAVEHSAPDATMPDGSPGTAWAALVRAFLCGDGLERMRADADTARAQLSLSSAWRPAALLLEAVARLLLGDRDAAEAFLDDVTREAAEEGAVYAGIVAHAERALLALGRGDLLAADAELGRARRFLDDGALDGIETAILWAAEARLATRLGDAARAREHLVEAERLRPLLTEAQSWFSVQVRVELARSYLALADPEDAERVVDEARRILRLRPGLGVLGRQIDELGAQIDAFSGTVSGWASTLTAAELRLLPLLTTHLSFREIAERLSVTRNTVKTQAISIYRKLDATSRSEAIARAVALGLVDPAVIAPVG
jgi:LuxR family maltose regulon positive regulatory protein